MIYCNKKRAIAVLEKGDRSLGKKRSLSGIKRRSLSGKKAIALWDKKAIAPIKSL
jgi:hypothetical protein